MLKPAREVRTAWVGDLPEALANDEARLADIFQQFGDVETITARVKPTSVHGPCKSWRSLALWRSSRPRCALALALAL